jgi:hypothetical protein
MRMSMTEETAQNVGKIMRTDCRVGASIKDTVSKILQHLGVAIEYGGFA